MWTYFLKNSDQKIKIQNLKAQNPLYMSLSKRGGGICLHMSDSAFINRFQKSSFETEEKTENSGGGLLT